MLAFEINKGLESVMGENGDIKKTKPRKPGARARWCPACRRIRPKGRPRGMSFTPERGRALALAAARRRANLKRLRAVEGQP